MALCYQTLHQGLGSLWNLCRPTLGWRSSWQKQAEDENNEQWPWKLAKSAPLAWTSEALGLTLYSFSLDGGFTRRHSLWILGAPSPCRAAAQRVSEPGRPKPLPSTADRENPWLRGFGEMVLLCSWVRGCLVSETCCCGTLALEGSGLSGAVGL